MLGLELLLLGTGASLIVGTVKLVERFGGSALRYAADVTADGLCELRAAFGAYLAGDGLPKNKRQAFGICIDAIAPPIINTRSVDTLRYLARTVQLYAETERKVDDAVERLEAAFDADVSGKANPWTLMHKVGSFLDDYEAIKKPTTKPVKSVQEAVREFHRQQGLKTNSLGARPSAL